MEKPTHLGAEAVGELVCGSCSPALRAEQAGAARRPHRGQAPLGLQPRWPGTPLCGLSLESPWSPGAVQDSRAGPGNHVSRSGFPPHPKPSGKKSLHRITWSSCQVNKSSYGFCLWRRLWCGRPAPGPLKACPLSPSEGRANAGGFSFPRFRFPCSVTTGLALADLPERMALLGLCLE